MVRVTRSRRRNCPFDTCAVHTGNRKRGPHMRGELIIPTPGDVQALVVRVWDDNGERAAHVDVYDRQSQTWTYDLPLPARPRKAYAGAVRRAREHLRAGAMS
mgnify:CR=1 FL=1